MLTRRGWGMLAGAGGLGLMGRLLGVQELYVLATAAAGLVLAAVWQVRRTPVALVATRALHPAKVHAGGDSRVDLAIRNTDRARTPVLAVRDPFDNGRRQARFLLAPLRSKEVARAAYRLPTDHRGVYSLGPLEVARSDAFGLAAAGVEVAAQTQLTVYPRVEDVVPIPQTIGHDPLAGSDHPTGLGVAGEDFYALRAYELGDDLRRVHWPSTARADDLMIRQDQTPWQGRLTVLLDVRRKANTPESLELAVSAAASVVTAAWRRRSLVRLVTTDGTDSGFAAGAAHVEAAMEHLATVQAGRTDRLAEILAGLRRSGNGGTLVAITAGAGPTDLEAIARLRARFGMVKVVVFEPSSYAATARPAPSDRPGGPHLVRVTAETPFAAAWNGSMARGGSGLVTRR